MRSLALCLLVVLSGCTSITSTFFSDEVEPSPYIGAYGDVEIMDAVIEGEFEGEPGKAAVAFTYGFFDFLPSLAMDTVLLPYTIPVWALSD